MTDIDLMNAGEIKFIWDLFLEYFNKGYIIIVYYHPRDNYPFIITTKNDIFMIDRGFKFYRIDEYNKILEIYLRW